MVQILSKITLRAKKLMRVCTKIDPQPPKIPPFLAPILAPNYTRLEPKYMLTALLLYGGGRFIYYSYGMP